MICKQLYKSFDFTEIKVEMMITQVLKRTYDSQKLIEFRALKT